MRNQIDTTPLRNLLETEEDQRLWRVFPEFRALQLFHEKKNVLVAPSMWDDPFENFLARCSVRIGNESVLLDGLTRGFYGQCWCHSEAETDATWRIYVPEKQRGIRICVKAGKLFDTVYNLQNQRSEHECYLGKVNYLTEQELINSISNLDLEEMRISGNRSIAETLLIKRLEFVHENETRLLCDLGENSNGDKIIKFDCDPSTLVEHVLLDPRWSSSEAELMKSQLQCLGYQGPIEHSKLYSVPEYFNCKPIQDNY